jgi:hypothetical protein
MKTPHNPIILFLQWSRLYARCQKKITIQFHIYTTFGNVTSTNTNIHYMKAMQKKSNIFIYPFYDILTTTIIT